MSRLELKQEKCDNRKRAQTFCHIVLFFLLMSIVFIHNLYLFYGRLLSIDTSWKFATNTIDSLCYFKQWIIVLYGLVGSNVSLFISLSLAPFYFHICFQSTPFHLINYTHKCVIQLLLRNESGACTHRALQNCMPEFFRSVCVSLVRVHSTK